MCIRDRIEEAVLVQLHVLQHHLLGAHEFARMLVVVSLDIAVAQLDRSRVGLDGEAGEIAGLTLEVGERTRLLLGDEAAGADTGTQLSLIHI